MSAINQHKALAMGKKQAASQQGARPGFKKGGQVAMTKKATGGAVKKPGGSCSY